MDKLKQWIAFTVLGAVVIVAGGWFLLVSPKKGEAAGLDEQVVGQEGANSLLRTQLTVLQAQAKELPKKQAELAAVAAKLPDNPSLPALIRAITAASTSAGVVFVSVTPGAPVASVVAAPVAPAAPAPAGGAPAPAAQAVAPAGPAAPAAGAPAAPAVGTPAVAATGGVAGQLASIPVTLNVVGDYFEIEQFLANLENLPRALRVITLAMTPGLAPSAAGTSGSDAPTTSVDDGRSLTATITGTVFLAAGRPAATPVVAPVAVPAK